MNAVVAPLSIFLHQFAVVVVGIEKLCKMIRRHLPAFQPIVPVGLPAFNGDARHLVEDFLQAGVVWH